MYHERTCLPTAAESIDLFRQTMKQCGGDPYAAAAKLSAQDPVAAQVLNGSGFTFEQLVELAGAYSETADGNSDVELLSVKSFNS